MSVLVTGNNGYIGSVLTKLLVDEGYDVAGLDTNYYHGCDFGDKAHRVKQIIKDIRQVNKNDLKGIDSIIHLAALSNDPLCELNPKITYEINHKAAVRLAKLAKELGIKRFVFASSQGMYGIAKGGMVNEDSPKSPLTAYAKSKLMAEKDIRKLADDKFTPVFLRPTTVCGVSPRLRCDILLNTMVAHAATAGKITLKVADHVERAVIHIEDIGNAFIAALKAPRDLVHNEAFNIGENKNNDTIHNMARKVKGIIPGVEIDYLGENDPDERSYRVDFTKIKTVLKKHFRPKWNIKTAAHELYSSYRENGLTKKQVDRKYIRLNRLAHLTSNGKLSPQLYWV